MRDYKDSRGQLPLNIRETRLFLFIALGVLVSCSTAFAATSTIDSTNKYAYGENIGWINFGTSEGDVEVGDTELTGYGWAENVGWISFNCSNTASCGTVGYKVTAVASAATAEVATTGFCTNCFESADSAAETPSTPLSSIVTTPPKEPPREATVSTLIPPLPEVAPPTVPTTSRFLRIFDFRKFAQDIINFTKIGKSLREGTKILVESIKSTIEDFIRAFLRTRRSVPPASEPRAGLPARPGVHPDPNTAFILEIEKGWRSSEE